MRFKTVLSAEIGAVCGGIWSNLEKGLGAKADLTWKAKLAGPFKLSFVPSASLERN
jgi:hypothetical protein